MTTAETTDGSLPPRGGTDGLLRDAAGRAARYLATLDTRAVAVTGEGVDRIYREMELLGVPERRCNSGLA